MEKFVKEFMRLSGASRQLAIAAWYSLDDFGRTKPTLSAYDYAKRYGMILPGKKLEG